MSNQVIVTKSNTYCTDEISAFFPFRKDLEEPFLDVVLEPGDGLVLPAFWFHHCEALSSPSVSINAFAPCSATATAATILGSGLPANIEEALLKTDSAKIENSVDPKILAALQGAIQGVMQHLYPHSDSNRETAKLAEELVLSRYAPIAPSSEAVKMKDFKFERNIHDACYDAKNLVTELKNCGNLVATEARKGVIDIVLGHLVESWCFCAAERDATKVPMYLWGLSSSLPDINKQCNQEQQS